MKTLQRILAIVFVAFIWTTNSPAQAQERCGGTERWAVKVGTDPDAASVDLNNVTSATPQDINNLPDMRGKVKKGDNTTRLQEERAVYKVKGRLVIFKHEKDQDYHLVITDDSLNYTPGGKGTDGQETGTSFIAEIPAPDCIAGMKGDPSAASQFDSQIKAARKKFEECFPEGQGADTDLGGIPVTITGVLFYDRPHQQLGRAKYGEELHPVLDISFDDTSKCIGKVTENGGSTTPPTPTQLLTNPGFEDGQAGWSGTVEDIDSYAGEKAHTGRYFAWMGGTGTAHTETLYQQVSIPSGASKATLSFWMTIQTEEALDTAKDKFYVQIRDNSGKLIKTLKKFTNRDSSDDYRKYSFDLSNYIGQDVQVYLKAVEDNGSATSFKLDDFALTTQ